MLNVRQKRDELISAILNNCDIEELRTKTKAYVEACDECINACLSVCETRIEAPTKMVRCIGKKPVDMDVTRGGTWRRHYIISVEEIEGRCKELLNR